MKRIVRVNIEKEIEIELTPAVFHGMTEAEYLDEFRKSLFDIDDIDDVFKYAATQAAVGGGGFELDGIGLLDLNGSTFPREPDTKFVVLDMEIETEIITE